ncbi:MAG: hypothetical protein VW736_02140, partial [Alphaproteobacteria bacterium]
LCRVMPKGATIGNSLAIDRGIILLNHLTFPYLASGICVTPCWRACSCFTPSSLAKKLRPEKPSE